ASNASRRWRDSPPGEERARRARGPLRSTPWRGRRRVSDRGRASAMRTRTWTDSRTLPLDVTTPARVGGEGSGRAQVVEPDLAAGESVHRDLRHRDVVGCADRRHAQLLVPPRLAPPPGQTAPPPPRPPRRPARGPPG